MLVRSQHHFLAELYFCLSHQDRHNAVRNAVPTHIEELFAWFMIFQGNIEQKLRQHISSVQGVLPCSLYSSCYYWTPFGARSFGYFCNCLLLEKILLELQVYLVFFGMKNILKHKRNLFGV